jgi:hypothetical protein
MCRSTNRLQGAEPEVWFRILHVAADARDCVPVAAYHEQTVEIALGPKGAFEADKVGTVTRQVAAERIVTAVPPHPGKPKTPRVVELLRKAIEWQALLESREICNQADIARREGITRACVTQVMGLLHLAPEIQQHILSMSATVRRPIITERALRHVIQLAEHKDQTARFKKLF